MFKRLVWLHPDVGGWFCWFISEKPAYSRNPTANGAVEGFGRIFLQIGHLTIKPTKALMWEQIRIGCLLLIRCNCIRLCPFFVVESSDQLGPIQWCGIGPTKLGMCRAVPGVKCSPLHDYVPSLFVHVPTVQRAGGCCDYTTLHLHI